MVFHSFCMILFNLFFLWLSYITMYGSIYRDQSSLFSMPQSNKCIFSTAASSCMFLTFNHSGIVRNLHFRVFADDMKISLVNNQTVHTNLFWNTSVTEKRQNLWIQTEADDYFCTFLLRNRN